MPTENGVAYSPGEKRLALEREIGFRQRVYSRRVAAGQMTQRFADEQIEIFRQMVEDYKKLEAEEAAAMEEAERRAHVVIDLFEDELPNG